jgi:hypothetical protein
VSTITKKNAARTYKKQEVKRPSTGRPKLV